MTDKIREKLLPCPFCGHSTPFIQNTHRDIRWMVYCEGCGASIKERISAEECVRLWNTRTNTANAEARELVGEFQWVLHKTKGILNVFAPDKPNNDEAAILRQTIGRIEGVLAKASKWLEEGK